MEYSAAIQAKKDRSHVEITGGPFKGEKGIVADMTICFGADNFIIATDAGHRRMVAIENAQVIYES